MGACCVDAAADFKSGWVQLKDIQAAKQFKIGIEELVVVDLRSLPEDPLPAGLIVRLRGAPLYLIAEGVLALIGVRQIGVIQDQQAGSEKDSGQQQRQRNTVQAETAGLERDQLVVFRHHAESNQHRYERGEGRELVKQVASKVHEIESNIDKA